MILNQGIGTPTEFIVDESVERDYYTKQETNDLLDKKQNKLTAGTNITIDKNNVISASGGGVDPNNYYTKPEVDEKLEDTKAQFPIAFALNAVGQEITTLETIDKTIVGAINEILKKQPQPSPTPSKDNWKDVAFNESTSGFKNQSIIYKCTENKRYRIWFNLNPRQEKIIVPDIYTFTEFIFSMGTRIPQTTTIYSTYIKEGGRLQLLCSRNQYLDVFKWEDMNTNGGNLWKLEELQE